MMSFEIKEKDLLARIGKLKTKSGTIETPLLFPVVNPILQPISPRRIREEFGFEALITNAYILKKRFQKQPRENELREFLDFNGVVMTDSGAYQILVYGDVEVTPEEIVEYQERVGSDIATILDIPTGWRVSEDYARRTVRETLRRAKGLFALKTRDDVLWVGPVQGGRYLDLVAKSARAMRKMPFEIYALGSPTEVMECYRFDVLLDMIMTAKMNLPFERPLHLFGAGHPFMFVLAVALGCDLFDSAAYALYAREGRYMTEVGTLRLNELEYFPCGCPKCTKTNPKKILELPENERRVFLAEHNLHICQLELKRIKQAINDGRLWEHLEVRAHGHPALLQAVKRLKKYQVFIEKHDPATKTSGLFFFDSLGLARPEVIHYEERLKARHIPPKKATTLLLAPQTRTKPFHKSRMFLNIERNLRSFLKEKGGDVHVCFYAAPFGVVPLELDEIYPLSQHEITLPLDKETIEHVTKHVEDYIHKANYSTLILLDDPQNWGKSILNTCKKVCLKRGMAFRSINVSTQQKELPRQHLNRILSKVGTPTFSADSDENPQVSRRGKDKISSI
jgi:7-cyano-7-deazaguanine tRNA-ribosyltransferase